MDSDSAGGLLSSPAKHEPRATIVVADATHPASPLLDTVEAAARNAIFAQLVTSDTDINGLVAYSIYKQNKLDWLAAFETVKGRPPSEAELSSYIIGEGTPRRLSTYRHLAESTLAGQGPANSDAAPFLHRRNGAAPSILTPGLIATYAIVAVLFVVGFWLAVHFTMPGR